MVLFHSGARGDFACFQSQWRVSRSSEAEVTLLVLLGQKTLTQLLNKLVEDNTDANVGGSGHRENRKRLYCRLGKLSRWCSAAREIVYTMINSKGE